MSKPVWTAALAAVALGACATATPYQEAGGRNGGYANQQIESDRWAISFSGNSDTDRQTVETYLLYRAAELTSQQGFDYFEIVTRDTDADTSFTSTAFGSPFIYNYYGFGYGYPGFYGRGFHRSRFFRSGFGFHDPFFGPTTFHERTRYVAIAEVVMGRGETPEDAAFFNAEDVLINLSGSIVLPNRG